MREPESTSRRLCYSVNSGEVGPTVHWDAMADHYHLLRVHLWEVVRKSC